MRKDTHSKSLLDLKDKYDSMPCGELSLSKKFNITLLTCTSVIILHKISAWAEDEDVFDVVTKCYTFAVTVIWCCIRPTEHSAL